MRWKFLVLPLLLSGATLCAAADGDGLRQRYPAGAWKSPQQAEEAVRDAQRERSQAEANFDAARRGCYKLFLTNACIIAARETRRQRLATADTVEIEAERFRRGYESAQRESARAEDERQRQLDEPQQAAQRAANVRAHEKKLADHAQKEKERLAEEAAAVPSPPERAAARDRLLVEREAADREREQQAAARVPERAARAAAHERELKDHAGEQARAEKERAARVGERRENAARQTLRIKQAQERQAESAKKRAANEAERARKRDEAAKAKAEKASKAASK